MSRGTYGRIVVCGSSLLMMTGLLSSVAPLRGRAVLDLMVHAFDYLTAAAQFWRLGRDPGAAFVVDEVLGGAAAIAI